LKGPLGLASLTLPGGFPIWQCWLLENSKSLTQHKTKKCDLTLIEINVICEVPIQIKSLR